MAVRIGLSAFCRHKARPASWHRKSTRQTLGHHTLSRTLLLATNIQFAVGTSIVSHALALRENNAGVWQS